MRSTSEKLFILFFLPAVVLFYLIYKYPTWFVAEADVASTFYWFGKSTSFWYNTVYTFIVCFIAGKIVLTGKTPYGKDKRKPLSPYQKKKFTSIFLAQLIFFYLVPFYLPYLMSGKAFFADTYAPLNKNAYVYVYNGFTSMGGFAYIFVVVPLSVWFFGKRYCSWFCACGNLAEAIGVTSWGNKWVTQQTPRGATSRKLEWMQYGFLAFAVVFGLVLLLHGAKVILAPDLVASLRAFQDLAVDLMFGALIGVGAYPFLGTRIWCRYGCPLAGMMRLYGKYSQSKFQVVANDKCKGLNLCTTQCPMGIDVASYAHENKVPKQSSFGLQNSPCIGCGGCIDICPVQALEFKKILNPTNQVSR
ncbi:MAG: 4Fe-4S binding protein [Pseudobdellovibrionaceae bacterium]|nr:4Fe-4S binding protein [Bdellovibrionales bacterium]USN48260.1 MAG: 4Fe-4S binding protein [Pseudobdellovibrionaceae bacterium]